MVNRNLIRIKVVQVAYAYYSDTNKNYETAEKELLFSLDKAYELYNSLLLLMVTLTDLQYQRLEAAKAKFLSTDQEKSPNTKFIDNHFVAQLRNSTMFCEYQKATGISWVNETILTRALLDRILQSETYKQYIESEESSYASDRELWYKLFKNEIIGNEDLEEWIEQTSVYWVDDLHSIATFVLKTIKRFDEQNGADQLILPMYKDDEDREYACELFRQTILHGEDNRILINRYIRNWELERVALMDIIIMLIAIAEMKTFPSIPVRVTLNEYIEIAKSYSTAKSGRFINGILDTIAVNLKKEGVITKE